MFLPCRPCCEPGCKIPDGKPRTDPKDEGTWVPSGTWDTGVTFTFVPNPGDESGDTWFFYGSRSTSTLDGAADASEQRDWFNICNWYSHSSVDPMAGYSSFSASNLPKRATRLPPETATVFVLSDVAASEPVTVSKLYARGSASIISGDFTATGSAHDSPGGIVLYNLGVTSSFENNSSNFLRSGVKCAGAKVANVVGDVHMVHIGPTRLPSCSGLIDGNVVAKGSGYIGGEITGTVDAYDAVSVAGLVPATVGNLVTMHDNSSVGLQDGSVFSSGIVFNNSSRGRSDFTGNATFNDSSECEGEVTGNCTFHDTSLLDFFANIIGNAEFYDNAICYGTVTGDGTFYNSSSFSGEVTQNAYMYQTSHFGGDVLGDLHMYDTVFMPVGSAVYGDAYFYDSSKYLSGSIGGIATFNDSACSTYRAGSTGCGTGPTAYHWAVLAPNTHPTCNGTAPAYCDPGISTCGCD